MKTVLITGATSGIGEALLEQYQQKGFHVIACGRNEQKLATYVETFPAIKTLAFDVTNKVDIARVTNDIKKVDILILNAGDCAYIDSIDPFDGELFSRIITTNLISLGYLLQYILPKVSAGGQVVFISSSATLLPFPKAEAYGASKAGVDYLANSLRLDLSTKNIEVTLVHPGFIKTPLTDKNTFEMPFMISSTQAAKTIVNGVNKRKQYLHFPKRLTLLLKVFSLLPASVWQKIAQRGLS